MLAVVFCHVGLGVTGGFVGVDVFFVISGYLITGLLIRDITNGDFSILDFWDRRIRRIVPALAVVTLVTILVGWLLMLPNAYGQLRESVVSLNLLISNIYFWENTGYFSPAAAEMPLLHTWSLAVEEQFYLVMPLLLLGVMRLCEQRLVSFIILVLVCGSFALSVCGTHSAPSATFYLLPTRAWELLVGSLLAFTPIDWRRHFPSLGMLEEVIGVVGLALIMIPCVALTDSSRFPGIGAVAPVTGTAVLIGLGIGSSRPTLVTRVLSYKPLVFIGLISYSLYLWHWPIIAFLK